MQCVKNKKIVIMHITIKSIAMQYATHKDEKDTVILNLLDCSFIQESGLTETIISYC